MNRYDLLTQLYSPNVERLFKEIYGTDALTKQQKRYRGAIRYFDEQPCWDFCTDLENIHIFRASSRTEICGNHTDHQHGEVLAAAIDQDMIAVAAPSDNAVIRITSDGFGETSLPLSADVAIPRIEERGTAKALLRGIVACFLERNCTVKGLCAYLTSDIPQGADMASSAAFENIVTAMLSGLFNQNTVSAERMAQIGQHAEKHYYGKPCGLMDQLASAYGGLLHMDFKDPQAPAIRQLDFDPSEFGYTLCLTDTHRSHGDLTGEYASVLREMYHVASIFGLEELRTVTPEKLMDRCYELCDKCGDRAFLRALHFVNENKRVKEIVAALEEGDAPAFLRLIQASGDSSFKYLQNIYSAESPQDQPLSVALAISKAVLGDDGVCRVHGGGFAGTVQAFVKDPAAGKYRRAMDAAFGPGSCRPVKLSPHGSIMIL